MILLVTNVLAICDHPMYHCLADSISVIYFFVKKFSWLMNLAVEILEKNICNIFLLQYVSSINISAVRFMVKWCYYLVLLFHFNHINDTKIFLINSIFDEVLCNFDWLIDFNLWNELATILTLFRSSRPEV